MLGHVAQEVSQWLAVPAPGLAKQPSVLGAEKGKTEKGLDIVGIRSQTFFVDLFRFGRCATSIGPVRFNQAPSRHGSLAM